MKILDRYILRNTLVPFLYCVLGFLAIWLVFDLGDNGEDFIRARVSPLKVGYFYMTQFPQIMVISLPIGLLLALLYSLSRMSRTNEIISMLGAGLSVTRLLVPLIVLGLITTALSFMLNYRLAPHSEAVKEQVFELITKGEEKGADLRAYLFRDRRGKRTWFISRMPRDATTMKGVHVMQQDADGDVIAKYYARRASYVPEAKGWQMKDGKTVMFDKKGNVTREEYWDEKLTTDWPETPQRIASSVMPAQSLAVDELRDYLRFNSDFPPAQLAPYRTELQYRLALPWTCLVVVFIAAPLGIVFSRRGVLAGVASSIFLFFGMIFVTYLFLALGKGAWISAVVAAWTPPVVFGCLGLVLLRYRQTNKDLPLARLFRPRVRPVPPAPNHRPAGAGRTTQVT
jgi:lipopolysaccharide export system permease protein